MGTWMTMMMSMLIMIVMQRYLSCCLLKLGTSFHLVILQELCAGLVDKNKHVNEIMKEEIEEECGYKIDTDRVIKLTSCRGSVGISGAKLTIFYAQVHNVERVTLGGGIETESM